MSSSSSSRSTSKGVYVNPSFHPHINPSKWLKSKSPKPHFNPSFMRPHINPNFVKNKENLVSLPQGQETPEQSSDEVTAMHSTPARVKYKRIGSRKLIRVHANTTPSKSPKGPTTLRPSSAFRAPSVFRASSAVSTPRKWLRKSPFHTFLNKKLSSRNHTSPHRSKGQGKSPKGTLMKSSSSKISPVNVNPYKLDRRPKQPQPSMPTNTKKEENERSFASKSPSKPSKPPRRTNTYNSHVVINVSGTRYRVLENGRKLIRVDRDRVDGIPTNEKTTRAKGTLLTDISGSPSFSPSKSKSSSSLSSPKRTRPLSKHKRVYLKGSEFTEMSPGVLTLSRNVVARRSINTAKHRSINTLLRQKRLRRQSSSSSVKKMEYCVFFNKFGRCHRQPSCPFVHDASRVRVCPQFILGACHDNDCALSHRLAPNQNMPVCSFFMQGLCARDNCNYRHVKVAQNAPICSHFLEGRCTLGDECKLRHERVCPQFDASGQCSKGKSCPWPHKEAKNKNKQNKGNKVPLKPTRTSVIAASSTNNLNAHFSDSEDTKCTVAASEVMRKGTESNPDSHRDGSMKEGVEAQSRGSGRYFEKASKKRSFLEANDDIEDTDNLEKIQKLQTTMDDDNSQDEEMVSIRRAPLGQLPSFIALDNCSSDGEESNGNVEKEEVYEERLV